jgi:hypothetical protein
VSGNRSAPPNARLGEVRAQEIDLALLTGFGEGGVIGRKRATKDEKAAAAIS